MRSYSAPERKTRAISVDLDPIRGLMLPTLPVSEAGTLRRMRRLVKSANSQVLKSSS
jgi:hypothetical protein